MSETAASIHTTLTSKAKQYNSGLPIKNHFNIRGESPEDKMSRYEAALDGDGLLENRNPLNAIFRKTFLKYFRDRLVAGLNATAEQLKINTDIVGVNEIRGTPPGTKGSLPNHVAVNDASTGNKEKEATAKASNDIILKQVSVCILAGQKLFKDSKDKIANHLKELPASKNLLFFPREVAFIICSDFFNEHSFNGQKEEEVIKFAQNIAHLSYIIILGAKPGYDINLKTKIKDEISASGILSDYANHAQMLEPALPGNSVSIINVVNGGRSAAPPLTYHYEMTQKRSATPTAANSSSCSTNHSLNAPPGVQHFVPEDNTRQNVRQQRKWYHCFVCYTS